MLDAPEPRYTRHQVARGARADAETSSAYYLFKSPSVLHATYQVRLLAFMAATEKKKLIIQVPAHCKKGASLNRLVKEFPNLVRFERV